MKTAISILCALALAACSEPAPSSGGSVPELTELHHCGYGFYVGNVDQTRALKITYQDYDMAQSSEVPRESALSNDDWSAELETGEDLFANWCDDVLEPDEPTPEVEEVWEVSGDIAVIDLPDPGTCGPATANLTGLEARTDDGDVISLGDLDVENEFWGCIAG